MHDKDLRTNRRGRREPSDVRLQQTKSTQVPYQQFFLLKILNFYTSNRFNSQDLNDCIHYPSQAKLTLMQLKADLIEDGDEHR